MAKKTKRRDLEIKRKSRMSFANRFLGWVTFAIFVLLRISPHVDQESIFSLSDNLLALGNTYFIFLIFLHALASVYLYGLPEMVWHPRVAQMVLGFVIVGIFILNRSFINIPILLTITDWLIILPILLHVGYGSWFLVQRWFQMDGFRQTPFYLGGPIVRDFSKE